MFYCYFISFLLTWAALSTYMKKKGTDTQWWNWVLHGFGIGMGMLPMVFIGISIWLIIFRAIVLGLWIMLWSEINNNAVWEECGRGALIVLTLPILFI